MDDEAPVHAERKGQLHRLDRVVAAIRIAGKVGLAHAGDDVLYTAPIGDRAGKEKNTRLRPGTNVVGRPDSEISIAISRVSAVSEISASASIRTT